MSPKRQYLGRTVPTTDATTGPVWNLFSGWKRTGPSAIGPSAAQGADSGKREKAVRAVAHPTLMLTTPSEGSSGTTSTAAAASTEIGRAHV